METKEHPKNTRPKKFHNWLHFYHHIKSNLVPEAEVIKWENVHNNDGFCNHEIFLIDVDFMKARCFEESMIILDIGSPDFGPEDWEYRKASSMVIGDRICDYDILKRNEENLKFRNP